ncbi:MAG: HAD family phosphatase [Clostridia bacterium]|nr:HAD family phosphatase [Clostridia bacterium]
MIKNLIFDVGRVLFDYSHENLLKPIGLTLFEQEQVCKAIFETDIWQQEFDRGLLTLEEATEKLVKRSPEYQDGIRFALSHPERMPVPRPEVRKRIEKLREMGYKAYYLSNYSKYFFDIHSKQTGILEYMDGGVLSADVHYIKPEREIYEILFEKYSLTPAECLFFDDRETNIIGGKNVGMSTFLVNSQDDMIKRLDELISQNKRCKIV